MIQQSRHPTLQNQVEVTLGWTTWPLQPHLPEHTEGLDQAQFSNVPGYTTQEDLAGVDLGSRGSAGRRQLAGPGAGGLEHAGSSAVHLGSSLEGEVVQGRGEDARMVRTGGHHTTIRHHGDVVVAPRLVKQGGQQIWTLGVRDNG